MRKSSAIAVVANFVFRAVLAWSAPTELGEHSAQIAFAASQASHAVATGGEFAGEQVWRVDMGSMNDGEKEDVRGVIEMLNLDIWRSAKSSLDIRIPNSQISGFRDSLPTNSNLSVFIPDIEALIDSTSMSTASLNGTWDVTKLTTPFHDQYHPLADIYSFADQLASAFNGRQLADGHLRMETFTLGKTYEKVEMKGMRVKWVPVTAKPTHTANPEPLPTETGTMVNRAGEVDVEKKKKKGGKGKGKKLIEREFVIQAGSHAREWIGPSSAVYFLHSLLLAGTADHESDEARLLQAFTFTVIPTINPDGYEYSRSHRMWRKNRQNVGSDSCSGIDLNSNWGYKWRKPLRPNPCSDSYPGTDSFEAYETKAIARYLKKGVEWAEEKGKKSGPERKVRSFIDLHSYGQLFMFPFAHSCDDFPPDAEMLMEAALGVAKAIKGDHGESYQTGQACELTFRAPGDAIDYAYGTADVRWSFSAELRDTGTYGFLLPPSLIRPAADEITTGLVHLAKFIYNVEIVN